MSKEKRRVPKLRFPGFTEDWEQRKLSDVLIERNEQQVETREYPLMSFVQGLGVTPKGERYDRSFLVLDQSKKYKRTELGDFIYSSNNLETGSIGINKTGKAVISPVYSIFQGVSIGDSQFIGIMSLLPRFIAKMIRFRQGVVYGQWRIHETDFLDISVLIPSVDERTKITQLILSIEELITLHQRKLDNLKLKKKALLQKLFPKNGDRYPELRFPGFTDAWEQRKLSDITYLSGIKNKENKPYESYSISNEFGFIPQAEQFENGGTMQTADKSMYYIVSQNSFAYNPARINVGSIGYYDKPDNVIVSSLYEVFKTTDIVNDKFLWHWFKSNQFNRLIGKYQEGGVRLYFYYDKLCKGTMGLPAINEQNKISNLLDDLDMYITLHQRKLDHLQLQKKALLQQIFV